MIPKINCFGKSHKAKNFTSLTRSTLMVSNQTTCFINILKPQSVLLWFPTKVFFFFQLCLNIIETTTQHTSRVRTNKWIYNWMRNVATNADTLTHIKMINWSNLQCTHLACGLEILERCIRSQFKQNLGLICTKLSNSQDTVHIFIGISNSMLELNFTWKAKNNVRKLECSSIK